MRLGVQVNRHLAPPIPGPHIPVGFSVVKSVESPILGFHVPGLRGYRGHLPHQSEVNHVTTAYSSGVQKGPSIPIATCSCTGYAPPEGPAWAQRALLQPHKVPPCTERVCMQIEVTVCGPQIMSSFRTPHLVPWRPMMGCGMAPSSMPARTLPSLRRDTSSTFHS